MAVLRARGAGPRALFGLSMMSAELSAPWPAHVRAAAAAESFPCQRNYSPTPHLVPVGGVWVSFVGRCGVSLRPKLRRVIGAILLLTREKRQSGLTNVVRTIGVSASPSQRDELSSLLCRGSAVKFT